MRKEVITEGEHYHIYNRGVEKRNIFEDEKDITRFIRGMIEFNAKKPIGSLFENAFLLKSGKCKSGDKIVDIVSYCINPNHFHLILFSRAPNGIQKYMHRLGAGYTRYFNEKYKRTGSLFQGTYKAKRITTNEYLTYLSAYVNLNSKVHRLGSQATKLSRSSWDFFANSKTDHIVSGTEIITKQFRNSKDYESFALDALRLMLEQKDTSDVSEFFIESELD